MHVVVIGSDGRLGAVLTTHLVGAGHRVTDLTLADLDITNSEGVARTIERLGPEAIINCSAYNAVDAAETDSASAFAVNAQGPAFLASAADASGAVLVHYSSDFVFDGEASEPYAEEAPTNPLSVYGASKLAGEHEVRKAVRHYVLRLESVFGGSGFKGHQATVDQIANRIREGSVVRAVADRAVTPSYVADVVRATLAVLEKKAPYGVYHCVNTGYTTWVDLAHEVARRLGKAASIEPVLAADFKTTARRPRFCALSNRKLLDIGIAMPTWQSAIERHLAEGVPSDARSSQISRQ